MGFSERIKRIRVQLGFSQEKMAHELGVSFATINRLETGKSKPSYDTLEKIDKFCKKQKISLGEKNE